MKWHATILALFAVINSYSQAEFEISYSVRIVNPISLANPNEPDRFAREGSDPYENHILINRRAGFFSRLIKFSGSGSMLVTDPESGTAVSLAQLLGRYCSSGIGGSRKEATVYEDCPVLLSNVKSIRFKEKWQIDERCNIRKTVLSYSPEIHRLDPVSGDTLVVPIFTCPGNATGFIAGIITPLISYKVSFPDLGNEGTQPELVEWRSLFDSLVMSGQIELYSSLDSRDMLDFARVGEILRDTILIEAWDEITGDFYLDFGISKLSRYIECIEFFESWGFDEQGNIVKEVLAITPHIDYGWESARNLLCIMYSGEDAKLKLESMNFKLPLY